MSDKELQKAAEVIRNAFPTTEEVVDFLRRWAEASMVNMEKYQHDR